MAGTLLSASGRCCVKESHFPEKLLHSRTYAQARRQPGARRGLFERPAEGAQSRRACSPCAPPGAARSAGRPGLASSSSGAGLRRTRRRRRHAPPGPDAGRRGSTPAFQNLWFIPRCTALRSQTCRPASRLRIWQVKQRGKDQALSCAGIQQQTVLGPPLVPCTGIFLGPSKSGKTVTLISLILEQYRGVFERIYIDIDDS